jgi:NADPH:quinone reductase
MKALLSVAVGGPGTLVMRELPEPQPSAGELGVRVLACGLNFPDLLIIEDRYQLKPPRPFAPGAEVCAEVTALGEGVVDWRVGDRLLAVVTYGGLSERMVLPAERAYPLPPGKDPVEGAALLLTYATACYALVDRGGLRRGQTLLVLGAAGGVGVASVELGKLLGARVIAAVSTAEKAAIARSAGADETIVYGPGELQGDAQRAFAADLKRLAGTEGAQLVCDPVGGSLAEPALRALGFGGRYLVVGFAGGIPRIPLNLPLLKGCDICGVYWGGYVNRDPVAARRGVERLLAWWQEGRLRPRVDRTFDLQQAREALQYVADRRALGKVVVKIA